MKHGNSRRPSAGRERRRHRMFVTKNSEYHFRGSLCVAVRDLRTGAWREVHAALRQTLSGAVRFKSNGVAVPMDEAPEPGDALYFGSEGVDLVTSVFTGVDRPPRAALAAYV